jgi:transposase
MQRREFSCEFKLEAVRLVRERGVAVAQAARDLDVHENVLCKWVKEFAVDPGHAFPGHGQMKPEQLEIDHLRREVAKLKAERGILEKAAAYFAKDSIWGSPSSRSTEGSGRWHGCVGRSVSCGVGSMPGSPDRRRSVPATMR